MVVVVMVVRVLYLVIIYYRDMSQRPEDCQPKTHTVLHPEFLSLAVIFRDFSRQVHVNVNVCNRFAWVLMVINSLQGGRSGRYKGENENQ